jgi:hypothetical protein
MNTICFFTDEEYAAEQARLNSLPKKLITIISIWKKSGDLSLWRPAFRYDILVPEDPANETYHNTLKRAYAMTNRDDRPMESDPKRISRLRAEFKDT